MAVNVVVKSVWDDKGVKQALGQLSGLGKSVGVAFAAVSAATIAAGVGIAKFSANAAKSGSNLAESLNAVKVSYGGAANEIIKLGETAATRLGVTQTEFNAATVRFSAFADRIVGDGGNVAGFIDTITTRATDFASVFNIEVAEALQVFQSGLSGEAEPLKRFGINLLDSEVKAYALANGIGTVGKELTETEKVQARYGLLLQSTNKVQGDFANTSDGLANRQRILQAAFKDLEAQVGIELLPAFEGILEVVQEDLFPIFQDMAKKAGPALANAFKFIGEVLENAFTEGTQLNTALQDLGSSFDLLFTTITNGQRDADGFADWLSNIVRILEFITTTLAAVIAGLQGFGYAFEALKAGDFDTFFKFLTTDTIDFITEIENAQAETNKLNSLSLSKFRSQLGDTRVDAQKLVDAQRELAYYMSGGKPGSYKPQSSGGSGGGGGGEGGSGSSPADQLADTRKKVQKIIQDAQKRVAEAQGAYTKAVTAADKAFLQNELKIREDYGNKLADIIEQSKNRIRDAYKSIAQFNVSTFLSNFQEVEAARLDSFNEAKKAAEEVGTAFTEVFTKGDPVKAYLDNLRAKIASNKKILDTSAKLLEAGFSQTFIEQIIATGETGGIALAEGLLASGPETIREVQALFKEIESVAGSGADTLADQLYEKQGLATQELVTLFEDTNKQLLKALAENFADYSDALGEAATALRNSLDDITTDFDIAIEGLDGKLGGLLATIKAFRASLLGLADDSVMATKPVTGGTNPNQPFMTPELWDVFDMAGAAGVAAANAAQFPAMPSGAGTSSTSSQPATIINVNVRTDQTQSTAQVGSVIANAINKYTANGGKLAVTV